MATRAIEIEIPESVAAALDLGAEDFAAEAKLALAVKFFELGRLTSGQAAALAGIPRARFLVECHRLGASSVVWDDEEIAAEFARD